MSPDAIKQLVQQMIDANDQKQRYSVSATPFHTHNGVGSNKIPFLNLSDVPNSYNGSAGKVATVNSTETGLEFDTSGSGITVKDGITTVASATTVKFTGAVVTNAGGGEADVAISGGTPGGSDTELQFNDAGVFGGMEFNTYPVMAFDKNTGVVTVSGDTAFKMNGKSGINSGVSGIESE